MWQQCITKTPYSGQKHDILKPLKVNTLFRHAVLRALRKEHNLFASLDTSDRRLHCLFGLPVYTYITCVLSDSYMYSTTIFVMINARQKRAFPKHALTTCAFLANHTSSTCVLIQKMANHSCFVCNQTPDQANMNTLACHSFAVMPSHDSSASGHYWLL